MIFVLLLGGRGAFWSSSFEYQESWNDCFFDTHAVSSHRRLLRPGTVICLCLKVHQFIHNSMQIKSYSMFSMQHIPKFMQWLKYLSFLYYGFRLLLKVQYNGDQLYECESQGGCRNLQSSPSFDTVNLSGGLQEVWVLLGMALAYRLCAYFCLRKRINKCHL